MVKSKLITIIREQTDYSGELSQLNREQLERILKFGDPRVFWEQEIDNELYLPSVNDVHLDQLRRMEKKEIIEEILDNLPECLQNLSIQKNNIDDLVDICLGKNNKDTRRMVLTFVLERSRGRISRKDLFAHFDMNDSRYYQHKKSVKIIVDEQPVVVARQLLTILHDRGMLSSEQLEEARVNINQVINEFPEIIAVGTVSGGVLAVFATQLTRVELKLSTIVEKLGMESLFLACKRAEIRSPGFTDLLQQLREKRSDARNILIEEIRARGVWRGSLDNYSKTELESILEYGDPRAYWQPQFSFDRSYYTDNKGISSKAHSKILPKHRQVQSDIAVAKKIGGWKMVKTVLRTVDSDTRIKIKKNKHISDVLRALPEKFHRVRTLIEQDDMNKLIEYCKGKNKQTVRKIVVAMVEGKALSEGVYVGSNELLKFFDIPVKGMFKIRSGLKQAGLLPKVTEHPAVIAAQNVLFQLKEKDILDDDQLRAAQKHAQTMIKKYPRLVKAREDLGNVIAVFSTLLANPELKIIDICHQLDVENVNYTYQACKRAEIRSDKIRRALSRLI